MIKQINSRISLLSVKPIQESSLRPWKQIVFKTEVRPIQEFLESFWPVSLRVAAYYQSLENYLLVPFDVFWSFYFRRTALSFELSSIAISKLLIIDDTIFVASHYSFEKPLSIWYWDIFLQIMRRFLKFLLAFELLKTFWSFSSIFFNVRLESSLTPYWDSSNVLSWCRHTLSCTSKTKLFE